MADIKDTSDGYHTFRELYDHRHALFIALCKEIAKTGDSVWRSRLHADGTMYDDSFIMGITEADRQISYHLPERLWSETHFARTIPNAPVWDGHTPADVVERLLCR